MFNNFWNDLCNGINTILNGILFILPDSPFMDVEIPSEVRNIFGYVNYFVPIKAMLIIAASWLGAIAIYYLYQTILRWAKAIK